MRRLLIPAAAVAVVAVCAILLFRPGVLGSPGASPSATPVPPVPVSGDVVAEGRAMPIRTASLGVLTGGTITGIAALGQTVKAGDTLLALDSGAADAALAGAEAALDAATAQRDQASAGAAQAGDAVDVATAAVTQAKAGVDQANAGVAQAKAGVAQAKAGVDQAKAGVNQAKAARDILPNSASTAQERQADAVVAGAEAQVDAANAALDPAVAAVDAANAAVDAAKAGLAQAQAQLQSSKDAVVAAQHAAEAAEAERVRAAAGVDSAREARALLTVSAPFDGMVAYVVGHIGETAPPGVALVRVADTSGWTFETTDLGEAGAARIKVGDPATITIDDVPGIEIPGTIAQIGGFGEDRQGDVAFRVVVTPTAAVPAAVRWNTIVTVTIHPAS